MTKDLPNSNELEQAVIGTILYNYKQVKTDIDLINPQYFYNIPNKIVIKSILKLHDKHKKIDATVIKNYLNNTNKLNKIGGVSYLTEFENQSYFTDNFDSYIEELKDYYERRNLIKQANDAIDKAYSETEINDIKSKLNKNLYSTNEKSMNIVNKGDFTKYYKSTIIDKINRTKVGTGFTSIDHYLSTGFQKRNTSIITGRSRTGKSALRENIMLNQLDKSNTSILLLSTEMAAEEELDRLVSIKTGLPLYDIINIKEWVKHKEGKIKAKYPEKLELIKNAIKWLNNKKFFLRDSTLSVSEIKSLVARYKEMYNIDICYIDLLDRVSSIFKSTVNKTGAIDKTMGEITDIAKMFDVHMCLVVQQRRNPNSKGIDKPSLKALRGSSSWEDMSDLVLGVYREYLSDEEMIEDNSMEVTILKQRQGVTKKTIELNWDGPVISIYDKEDDLI